MWCVGHPLMFFPRSLKADTWPHLLRERRSLLILGIRTEIDLYSAKVLYQWLIRHGIDDEGIYDNLGIENKAVNTVNNTHITWQDITYTQSCGARFIQTCELLYEFVPMLYRHLCWFNSKTLFFGLGLFSGMGKEIRSGANLRNPYLWTAGHISS